MLKNSTVMVTGGCGFIGSHLVRHLVERSVKRVVIIDSLRYGDPGNLGAASSAVEIVKHQIGIDTPEPLHEAMKGVDYLFHLAAEKHNQSKDSPITVLRSNVEGMHTLLASAAAEGVKKVVFSSSLYAYGRMNGAPFVETEVPHPNTVYGISKLTGEHLLAHFALKQGLAYNALRYLFVYGPRQFAGMGYKSVIVKNCERLLADQSPIIFGDGKQTLDYVFVDDVVDATVRALETEVSGEVINIGSGIATPVARLIETLISVSKKSIRPSFEPADWTHGSFRVGNVEKVKKVLGWSASTSLEEGLRRTYDWIGANS